MRYSQKWELEESTAWIESSSTVTYSDPCSMATINLVDSGFDLSIFQVCSVSLLHTVQRTLTTCARVSLFTIPSM